MRNLIVFLFIALLTHNVGAQLLPTETEVGVYNEQFNGGFNVYGGLTSEEFCKRLLEKNIQDYNKGLLNFMKTDSQDLAAEIMNLTALKMALQSKRNSSPRSRTTYRKMLTDLSADIRRRDTHQVAKQIVDIYKKHGKATELNNVRRVLTKLKNGQINIQDIDPSFMVTLQYMYGKCDESSDSTCYNETDVASSWMMRNIRMNKRNFPSLISQGESYLQSINSVERYINEGEFRSIAMLEDKIKRQTGIVKGHLDDFLAEFTEKNVTCSNFVKEQSSCNQHEFFAGFLAPKFIDNLQSITSNEDFVLMNEASLLRLRVPSNVQARLIRQGMAEFAGENLVGSNNTEDNQLTCGGVAYHEKGDWGVNISLQSAKISAIEKALSAFNDLKKGRDTGKSGLGFTVSFNARTRKYNNCCNEVIKKGQENSVSLGISGSASVKAFYGFPGIGELGFRLGARAKLSGSYRTRPTCEVRNPIRCYQAQITATPFGEVYAAVGGGLLEPKLGVRLDPRIAGEVCGVDGDLDKALVTVALDHVVVYGAVTYGWFFETSIDRGFEIGFKETKEIVF